MKQAEADLPPHLCARSRWAWPIRWRLCGEMQTNLSGRERERASPIESEWELPLCEGEERKEDTTLRHPVGPTRWSEHAVTSEWHHELPHWAYRPARWGQVNIYSSNAVWECVCVFVRVCVRISCSVKRGSSIQTASAADGQWRGLCDMFTAWWSGLFWSAGSDVRWLPACYGVSRSRSWASSPISSLLMTSLISLQFLIGSWSGPDRVLVLGQEADAFSWIWAQSQRPEEASDPPESLKTLSELLTQSVKLCRWGVWSRLRVMR